MCAAEQDWDEIAADLEAGRKPSLPCTCLTLGVPKESYPGEKRVACSPTNAADYIKRGFTVAVESGAGEAAGFKDDAYK